MELLNFNRVCNHTHVSPEVDFAYCPDCGELIENQWYLVRCACCGVKLRGMVRNGEIVPEKHFCHNCGTREYVVERINKINFVDISYAVLIKSVVQNEDIDITQSWVDFKTPNYRPKLIGQL
ncbi:hypothetical protein J6P92_05510 [bacterium]|nr:hypothetical protein [bacterium]